jgi:hypothetical protein
LRKFEKPKIYKLKKNQNQNKRYNKNEKNEKEGTNMKK